MAQHIRNWSQGGREALLALAGGFDLFQQ